MVQDFRTWHEPPFVTGLSDAESQYFLLALEFHWNYNSMNGSEHTIDGESFGCEVCPLEVSMMTS